MLSRDGAPSGRGSERKVKRDEGEKREAAAREAKREREREMRLPFPLSLPLPSSSFASPHVALTGVVRGRDGAEGARVPVTHLHHVSFGLFVRSFGICGFP